MAAVLDAVLATYPSWSLLVVRVGLGVIFFAHGAQKVLGWFGGHGLAATIKSFRGMGVPPAAAAMAAFIEFLGGLGMLFGLLARPAAIGIIVVMLVAIAKVHGKHGFFLSNQGFEYNLALIGLCLPILICGPGRFSIGRYLPLPTSTRTGRPVALLE